MRSHTKRLRRRFRSAKLVIKIKGKSLAGMANKDAARSSKSPTPISELAAGFVHLKACSTQAAEHVDTNDRHSGRYTELTRDGGRRFASPFLHRRKADPTARPYPLPGTLTFFGTVFMAL